MALHVANTIREQLGGSRFIVMTGARNFVGGENFLQFSIGRGAKNKANKVRITLDETDTYTVEFFRQRGIDCTLISEHPGQYFDHLAHTFTAETGLDTRL